MPNYRSPRRALTRRRLRGQLGVNRVWDRHMPSWGRRPAPSSPSPPCAWPTCVSAYEPGEAGPALEVNWRCRPAARCRARRRRPEHQEQLGGQHQENQGQGWPPPRQRCSPSGQGQSRDERAHAARRAVAQRPGAGTRVLGVHGLTGRCECARCVAWGSNLPDGDPKILGGRDPESRLFFWNTRFFSCCACHFRK
jgi:hypothetical protein